MFNAILTGMRLRSWSQPISYAGAVHLGLIAIMVREYDPAISFFVNVLGFELMEDSPARTNDGRPKRWVGFFLNVEDFHAAYARMASAGVQFLTAPRTEPYGHVAVFLDIAGNKWDLIGPAS